MKKYVRLFAAIVVLAAFALMALGSGSDSEEVKAALGEEAAREHPARYALAEVVNLHDAALQDSYGVKTPEALLHEMLDNAGEYAALVEKVSAISGFNRDFRAEVEEAKN